MSTADNSGWYANMATVVGVFIALVASANSCIDSQRAKHQAEQARVLAQESNTLAAKANGLALEANRFAVVESQKDDSSCQFTTQGLSKL